MIAAGSSRLRRIVDDAIVGRRVSVDSCLKKLKTIKLGF